MTFPPKHDKKQKSPKIKGIDAFAKKTHVSFPVPKTLKKSPKPSITGADFYKEAIDSDIKKK